jgi:hypothetical protein
MHTRVDTRYPLPLFLLGLSDVPADHEGEGYLALQQLARKYPSLTIINMSAPYKMWGKTIVEQESIGSLWVRSILVSTNTYYAESHPTIKWIKSLLSETPVALVCHCCWDDIHDERTEPLFIRGSHPLLLDMGQQLALRNPRREVWSLEWPYHVYRKISH